jgi:nucleoside-diphosphate-sugar epimerase
MAILVVGASGATGRLLVQQLLDRGKQVKVIVRFPEKLPETLRRHDRLSVIRASISDLGDAEMKHHVQGCSAVASCLGHNLNLKGIFGQPRRLVTDATRRLCAAITANKPLKPIRFVLMNTAGNRNRDLNEPIPFWEKMVVGLVRVLIPPHADNENAADYLRINVGHDDAVIEWVVVRPDSLTNEAAVTRYDVHPSPVRSALFNAGITSRINVGHFMADLIADDSAWLRWKGQMPVIYNRLF